MFEWISSIDCTLIFLCSGENVCVSMFDSLALVFHTKFDSYGREPKVIVATGLNPKIVGGRRFKFQNFGCIHTYYRQMHGSLYLFWTWYLLFFLLFVRSFIFECYFRHTSLLWLWDSCSEKTVWHVRLMILFRVTQVFEIGRRATLNFLIWWMYLLCFSFQLTRSWSSPRRIYFKGGSCAEDWTNDHLRA